MLHKCARIMHCGTFRFSSRTNFTPLVQEVLALCGTSHEKFNSVSSYGALGGSTNSGYLFYSNASQNKNADDGISDCGARELSIEKMEKIKIGKLLKAFGNSETAAKEALNIYVNAKLWPEAVSRFRRYMQKNLTQKIYSALKDAKNYDSHVEHFLFSYFSKFVQENYKAELESYKKLIKSVDLRNPHLWYPMARSLQRKVIYHAGPTNSGKTYTALKAFKSAEKGIYCGPLRLLAMEVYMACNLDGVKCNLITGQERREVPGAQHTSSTVEMVGLGTRYDVCVIDEIQLLGDEDRGYAWTRVLQGVSANEIHLCGDPSAVPLVSNLCKEMNEELEIKQYDRFTPLKIDAKGLRSYKEVESGDCVVVFSRREIFEIKQMIESETLHKVCVVYGALPPETRRQQAILFNEPENDYNVLVASDAVGMGLNLNIRRIIFHTMEKFDGPILQEITPSQIKQIAGRAGRRNSIYPQGFATCLNLSDIGRLEFSINLPTSKLQTECAGIFPEFHHIEKFSEQFPGEGLCELLVKMLAEAKLDGKYFFCKQESLMEIAKMLQKVPELSLKDRFTFCLSPVNVRDTRVMNALWEFARIFAKGYPVCCKVQIPEKIPTTDDELKQLETLHQVVSMWLWLSMRFEEKFPGRETAGECLAKILSLMNLGLERLTQTHKQQQENVCMDESAMPVVHSYTSHTNLSDWKSVTKFRKLQIPMGITMGRRKNSWDEHKHTFGVRTKLKH